MEKLTDKQYKTQWGEIKKQIKERPLLAYRVGIPLDKWDEYIYSIPPKKEIDRIYIAIQEDRRNKTLRIKEELSKIVGYRESKEFSRKIGISDTSIRQIIEEKKEMAGYDLIDKIEIFLSVINPDFNISLENKLDLKSYNTKNINKIAFEIIKVAENIKEFSYNLIEQTGNQKIDYDFNGNKVLPTFYLDKYIQHLTDLKNKVDLFWTTFIDRK